MLLVSLPARAVAHMIVAAAMLIGQFLGLTTSSSTATSAPLALDTFARTVPSGLGAADTGGAWQLRGGVGSDYAVHDSAAWLRTPPGAARMVSLPSAGAKGIDLRVLVDTTGQATGAGQDVSLLIRQSATGAYQATMHIFPSGNVTVGLSRTDASGAVTVLAKAVSAHVVHRPGTPLLLELRSTGGSTTTLRAAVDAGGSAGWQVHATDASVARNVAGGIGVQVSQSSRAVATMHFRLRWLRADAVTAVTTGPGDPDPTPPSSGGGGQYGTLPIGTARYALPPNAVYVAPTGSDAAGRGTIDAPLATVQRALAVSPSGSTIVLRAGFYHQSATETAGKHVTIENYPGEAVWFDGSSAVTGFAATSINGHRVWVKAGWDTRFPEGGRPAYVDSTSDPLATYPDEVWRDGVQLHQVASTASVVPGTFAVDNATERLVVGDDPTGHLLRGATLQWALQLNQGSGNVLRGIGFRRYATYIDQDGMVRIGSPYAVVENCEFDEGASAGLNIVSPHAVIRHDSFHNNGQAGLIGGLSDYTQVVGNDFAGNDFHDFKLASAEGGVKFTTSDHMVWSDNLVRDSMGRGMWCDAHCLDLVVVRNYVRDNADRGIEFEIGNTAVIAGNVVVDNGQYGIYAVESVNVRIYNNSLFDNGRDIWITDGPRHSSDPVFPEDVHNVQVRNNILAGGRAGTTMLAGVADPTGHRTAAQMGVTFDDDSYWRPTTRAPSWLIGWPTAAQPTVGYLTLPAFRAASGQEAAGTVSEGPAVNPYYLNAVGGNFGTRTASAPLGVPLPADIAADLGSVPGVPLQRGAPNFVTAALISLS